jgi:single-strand DNA-binding protein
MSLQTDGKLHKVFDAEEKSGTFKTRDFVIEIPGQYPQYIKFQLTQDRCDLIDKYKIGDQINVAFDLRGREWQGKFLTNLQAWKIQLVGQSTTAPAQPATPETAKSTEDLTF